MPKQFLKLVGDLSSFQETLRRLNGFGSIAAPLIVASEAHRFLLAQQAMETGTPLGRLIIEPIARDTAAAVAAAAVWLARSDPEALMLVMPADHHIAPMDRFIDQVGLAAEAALGGRIVTFGVTPRSPSSSFGYIQRTAETHGGGTRAVAAFIEKPSAEAASRFIAAGDHLWNCGLVLGLASTLIAEFAKYRPDILKAAEVAVRAAEVDRDFVRLARAPLEACAAISLDYAILEKSNLVSVRELEGITWSDVGTWAEIHALSPHDESGNAVRDNAIFIDAHNCLAHVESGRVAALVGVSNLVLVSTPDVVFVAPLDSAGALKSAVQMLRATRPELVSGRPETGKEGG